jgi:26S proteasome regulatory subunit N6
MSRIEEAAQAKQIGNVVRAEQIYDEILSKSAGTNEAALREQESALIQLGEVYRDQRQVDKLVKLIQTSRTIMSHFAKAKTAKIGNSTWWCAEYSSSFD